jgi:hypothetical protein
MNNDVKVVKELGEKIGYGHLMSLASSLWRQSCRENGYPIVGAFVPTCIPFVKDEHKEMHETGVKHYDNYIK